MLFTLEQYVEQSNAWNAIFGKPAINLSTITEEECQDLARKMDSEIGPENLTCDGELSAGQVRVRAQRIQGAWRELCELCEARGFAKPQTYDLA